MMFLFYRTKSHFFYVLLYVRFLNVYTYPHEYQADEILSHLKNNTNINPTLYMCPG